MILNALSASHKVKELIENGPVEPKGSSPQHQQRQHYPTMRWTTGRGGRENAAAERRNKAQKQLQKKKDLVTAPSPKGGESNIHSIMIPNDCDDDDVMSQLTMETFPDHQSAAAPSYPSSRRTSAPVSPAAATCLGGGRRLPRNALQHRQQLYKGANKLQTHYQQQHTYPSSGIDPAVVSVASDSSLFTFRRRQVILTPSSNNENDDTNDNDNKEETTEEKVCFVETTLYAHNAEDEKMKDMVKRLQKDTTSGVLKFSKSDVEKLKKRERHLIFALPQVNNAKFSTEEFGKLRVSEVLSYTKERPLVVELFVEDPPDGEQLDIF